MEKVLGNLLANYRNNYLEYKNLLNKITELEKDSSEVSKQLDFINYQVNEMKMLI